MARVVLITKVSSVRSVLEHLRVQFEQADIPYEIDLSQPLAPLALVRSLALEHAVTASEHTGDDSVIVASSTIVRSESGIWGRPTRRKMQPTCSQNCGGALVRCSPALQSWTSLPTIT